jgi:hypothetical protein
MGAHRIGNRIPNPSVKRVLNLIARRTRYPCGKPLVNDTASKTAIRLRRSVAAIFLSPKDPAQILTGRVRPMSGLEGARRPPAARGTCFEAVKLKRNKLTGDRRAGASPKAGVGLSDGLAQRFEKYTFCEPWNVIRYFGNQMISKRRIHARGRSAQRFEQHVAATFFVRRVLNGLEEQ